MKLHQTRVAWVVAGVLLAGPGSFSRAGTVQQYGNYGGWGSVPWQVIQGLNDPDDFTSNDQLDVVGDAADPAGYWGLSSQYVYFRMRLDIGTVISTTFTDSHFVLVDAVGFGADDGRPDYAFAWDSKSNDAAKHGLEMTVLSVKGPTWGETRMDDLDGDAGKKLPSDLDGAGRTAEGYLQTTDGISTAHFGTTTFLDFAVSRSYLANYVPALATNSTWRIQFATIANATDHNPLSKDVAGGLGPDSAVSLAGWSSPGVIPEPFTATVLGLFGGGLLAARRLRRLSVRFREPPE